MIVTVEQKMTGDSRRTQTFVNVYRTVMAERLFRIDMFGGVIHYFPYESVLQITEEKSDSDYEGRLE